MGRSWSSCPRRLIKRCRRCCTKSSRAGRKLLTWRSAWVEEQGSTCRADNNGDADEARAPARRKGAMQRGRAGGAQAQDAMARRHHALGDVAAGVDAAAGSTGDQRAPFARSCPGQPCRPRQASGPAPRQAQKVHWTVCVRARPAPDPLTRRATPFDWTASASPLSGFGMPAERLTLLTAPRLNP